MENWFEDTFDEVDDFENDHELDDINAAEEEAALYSVVHHSEESFDTTAKRAGINSDDYPLSSRSKVSRWRKISKTNFSENSCPYENDKRPKECSDYISLETPNLQCSANRRGVERYRNRKFGRYNGERRKYRCDLVKHSRDRTANYQSHCVPSNEQQETDAPNVHLNVSSEPIQFSFLEELRKLKTAKVLGAMQSVDNRPDVPKFFENPLLWPAINSVQNTNVLSPVQIESNDVDSTKSNDIPPPNSRDKEIENCDSSSTPSLESLSSAPNRESLSSKDNDVQKKVSSINQEIVCETNDSVLQLHSDSDSDIVEVQVPPKPPPPVIALDSGDEVDKVTVSKEDPDVIVLDSDSEDLKVVQSAQPTLLNITSVQPPSNIHTDIVALPQTTVQVESGRKMSLKKSTGKEPKKKQKRKERSCDAVECNDVKAQMEKFYCESWGGETFDHMAMLRKMSNNPQHWKISEADRYGIDPDPLARVRCRNCNERGHLVKNCPRQKICCFMCGEGGHKEYHCPAKSCLRCGLPSAMFSDGCSNCIKIPLRCDRCGQKDHLNRLCPNVWRRFHSVTTVEGAKSNVLPAAVYKDSHELACSTCAQRGHTSSGCPRKGTLGRFDGFSNIFHHNRMPGVPFAGRRPVKRKQRDWHGETSRQDWNDHRYKKRRTF